MWEKNVDREQLHLKKYENTLAHSDTQTDRQVRRHENKHFPCYKRRPSDILKEILWY